MRRLASLALGAVSIGMLLPGPVAGGEPAAVEPYPETIPVGVGAADEQADGRDPEPIEEIIVTATKRAAAVRSIAASISAIKGEELEALGVQGVQDIVKLTPGVNFTDNGSEPERVTIRGIAADSNGNQTTGVFMGDIPFTDPYLPRVALDPNPFDLATVEVLKGPQGTLFGGSALNGAVRYVPREPDPQERRTHYVAGLTSIAEGALGTMAGGAINLPGAGVDSLTFRLTGFKRDAAGWVDEHSRDAEDVNTIDQSGIRAQALWQPGDAWEVLGSWMEQDTLLLGFPYTDNFDGRLERSNTPRENLKRTRYDIGTLRLRKAFEAFELTTVTAYLDKHWQLEQDVSRIASQDDPPPTLLVAGVNGSESILQELRLASAGDSRWSWFGGVFAQRVAGHDDIDTVGDPGLIAAGEIPQIGDPGALGMSEQGGVSGGRVLADITLTELAAFGELSWRPWLDWEFTTGLRLYRLKSDGEVTTSGAVYSLGNPGEPERTTARVVREQGVSPKLSASWTAHEQLMSYVSISRGFRFGGQQRQGSSATTQVPEEFQSDTLWSYEAGLRSEWLDDHLIADITAYYIDWKDPQIFQQSADGLITYVDNVGAARSHGLEAALQYRLPIRGLRAGVTAAYGRTRTAAPFTTGSGQFVPSGSPWPLSPRWQFAATLQYRGGFGPIELDGSLVHSAIDSAIVNLGDDTEVFDYGQWDAQLTLGTRHPQLPKLTLIANNLADERGVVGAFDGAFTDVTYIRPRALTLRLQGEF